MNNEDKTIDAAMKAKVAADEASKKADKVEADAGKSKERLDAEAAAQKADDLMAKANEASTRAAADAAVPMTAAEAGVLAPVPPDMLASDHRAQKLGNDPANPKPAPGVDMTANLVKLSRKTPDLGDGGLAYCEAPKEMVGDYLRAGWNVATA